MLLKKALLVTFDFSQRGKSGTGYAAGCLMAACRSHKDHSYKFIIEHRAICMDKRKDVSPLSVVNDLSAEHDLSSVTHIAIACYVWSHDLVEPLINLLRRQGFNGKVILGGYQVHADSCKALYPNGDIYIVGAGEQWLPMAILDDTIIGKRVYPDHLEDPLPLGSFPSPYLKSIIKTEMNQRMVHWETKRGCTFKCNFCQHRDVSNKPVQKYGLDRVKKELDYFKKVQVQKINVLDPIFNQPKDGHEEVLRYSIEIGLKAELNFQVRFEFITPEFLNLCKQLNVFLEFGLQTAIPDEFKVIDRPNHLEKVRGAIDLLQAYEQPFQVSLIYGLPNQTVSSFQQSIDFLRDRGVNDIAAFPLMLLEGTKLKRIAANWSLASKIIDDSLIPHVVSSTSFSEEDYGHMQKIAASLQPSAIEEAA